jgi:hypothetical protein
MQETIRSGKRFRRGTRTDTLAVLACAFYVTACGGDSSGGNACGISGCGGDIKGTWDVTGICITTSKLTDPSTGIAACDAVARAAVNTAKVAPMNMTITFTGTDYTLSGTAQLQFDFVYTKECLNAQGGSGASQATCNALQMGFGNSGLTGTCMLSSESCVCDATEDMPLSEHNTYSVDGTNIVEGSEHSPFCVKGDVAQFSSSNGQLGGSFSLKRAAAQTP